MPKPMISFTITVDDTDPTLVDPYTVCENIIDAYNESRRDGEPPVQFVEAEWL